MFPLAVQQQATSTSRCRWVNSATSVEVQSHVAAAQHHHRDSGAGDREPLHDVPTQHRPQSAGLLKPDTGRGGRRRRPQRRTNTNFVANGARNSTSDVLVDGAIVNTTEQNTGRTDLKWTPSVDAVLEFKMQTNFFGAEYAQSGGAIINMVTKSGTNEFHGTPTTSCATPHSIANSWSDNRAGAKKPYYRRDQLGAVLGGPIRKNKTFFFVTTEYTHSKSPQTLQRLPSPRSTSATGISPRLTSATAS